MMVERAAYATAAWLLTYAVHSTLLIGGVWALCRFRPSQRHAGIREALWRAALLGGAVTSLAAVRGLSPFARVVAIDVSLRAVSARTLSALAGAPAVDHTRWAVATVPVLVGVIVTGCVAIGIGRVAALVWSHRLLHRALAGRVPVADSRVRMRLHALSLDHGVVLSQSDAIATPMVLGRREICLPDRALRELSTMELDAVLAHEAAHLARRDGTWLWLGTVAERALWFQPLNRRALRELRLVAECACDDWALDRVGSPIGLASALTRVAGWLAREPVSQLPIVGMAARESIALARVRRMLVQADQQPSSYSPRAPGRTIRCLAALLPLAFIGMAAPRFANHELAGLLTVRAHDDAGPFTVTFDGNAVVAVSIDGVPVAPGRLHATGDHVQVLDHTGRPSLDLRLRRPSGFVWTSRPPRRATAGRIH